MSELSSDEDEFSDSLSDVSDVEVEDSELVSASEEDSDSVSEVDSSGTGWEGAACRLIFADGFDAVEMAEVCAARITDALSASIVRLTRFGGGLTSVLELNNHTTTYNCTLLTFIEAFPLMRSGYCLFDTIQVEFL